METSAIRSMRADFAASSSSALPSKDVLRDLNRGLKVLSEKHADSILKVEKGPTLYKILCSDCRHWTNFCPLQASSKRISDTINIAEKHIATDKHRQQTKKKVDAINTIADHLPELCDRFPGSKLEVKIPPFGTGSPWITCAACPTWTHKTFAGEVLSMTLSLLQKHLKSGDHEDALEAEMEDAADPQSEENECTADEETYVAEELRLSGPESETSSDSIDSDAMDLDEDPQGFPSHLTSKFETIKVSGAKVLYCRACAERTTADATAPMKLMIINAEKHLATAKHQCADLSNLLSDKAGALQDSSAPRGSIGAFNELIKEYILEYPLVKLEFKPSGHQINALQCMVCRGAGFHKYLFKNTVDSFASASLRKAAQHLASKEHQAAAEMAESGRSMSDRLQDSATQLRRKFGDPFHVEELSSRTFEISCKHCLTWSYTYKVGQGDNAISILTVKAVAQTHLASTLHIGRSKARISKAGVPSTKPDVQPTTGQLTESQLAGVVRVSHPPLAATIEDTFRSLAKNKVVCTDCNKFFDNVYNGNYIKNTIKKPLQHVQSHAIVPYLKSRLAILSPPGSACVFNVDMNGVAVSINCVSCPSFAVWVPTESPKDGIKAAEAHMESRKSLSREAVASKTSVEVATTSGPHSAASSRPTPDLQLVIDALCRKHSPQSSFAVTYTAIHTSRMCKLKCRDCPQWSFGSPQSQPFSNEDTTHFIAFRAMAKQHLQTEEHRLALRARVGSSNTIQSSNQQSSAGNSRAAAQFATAVKQTHSSSGASSPDTQMPRLKAAIDKLRDEVSPLSNIYIVPAPMSSRRLEVKCTHCSWWYWIHDAALADVPRNFNNTLGAVKMHIQSSRHTSALLSNPAAGKSAASGVKAEPTLISRKNKPSQQLTPETVKRIRSATHEAQATIKLPPSSSSSNTHPPSSPGEASESTLLAACKKWFPSKASDIQKAFIKYTTGDIDCGECEDVFEKIAESESYMAPIPGLSCQHVLDHMFGSTDESVKKSPQVQPAAPATNDAQKILQAKYPTSSFSFQRNWRNEECFTCHDCSRTLLSGACMRNFEQHLESAGHARIVGRKGK
ncbi:hypothetical protein ACEPPN_018830 [Leptodophora sp. 'Broadleaf-Isolate-01']